MSGERIIHEVLTLEDPEIVPNILPCPHRNATRMTFSATRDNSAEA